VIKEYKPSIDYKAIYSHIKYLKTTGSTVQQDGTSWYLTQKFKERYYMVLLCDPPDVIKPLLDFVFNLFDNKVTLKEVWSLVYDQGMSLAPHTHDGSDYSFLYFVNTPEGSSPLIIDDYVVEPEVGKLVIFKSKTSHYVPTNNCEGRCVVAGELWNDTD
tara:strand:- start:116 stop:592 length:477 start_codon:yes stop_codon:yes gene_type:complete